MIVNLRNLGTYSNVVDFAIGFKLEKEYRILTRNEGTKDLQETIGECGSDDELIEQLLGNIDNRKFHVEMNSEDDFIIWELIE